MTIHRTYIPQPPLSAFVHMFWLYEGQQQHAMERRLPDGSVELVINLREDTLRVYDRQHHDQFQSSRGGLISGAHSEFIVLDTTCLASIIGIHFKPGGAFPFLTLPAGELHDEIVSLETLWGATARDQVSHPRTVPSGACRPAPGAASRRRFRAEGVPARATFAHDLRCD